MSALNATSARGREDTLLPLRARHAVLAAAAMSAVLLGCWYVAFHSVTVARADAHAYVAFLGLSQHHLGLRRLADALANLCRPDAYVCLSAIPVSVALLRRRWALALALIVIIPAAPLSTELLKPLLAAHRPAIGILTPASAASSWPSGHSTGAMILALSLVLASPARWRAYVTVGGTVFALAVIYSVLSLGWHFPSDALGGILLALIWTLLAVAAVLSVDARFGRDLAQLRVERRHWLRHMPSVPAMLTTAVIPAAVVLLWRGARAVSFAGHHGAFLAATLGLAAAAVSAPTALTWVLGGNDRARLRAVGRPAVGAQR